MHLTFSDSLALIATLEAKFNESQCAKDRLAYATGMRVELAKLLETLDDGAIPMFQKVVANQVLKEG